MIVYSGYVSTLIQGTELSRPGSAYGERVSWPILQFIVR